MNEMNKFCLEHNRKPSLLISDWLNFRAKAGSDHFPDLAHDNWARWIWNGQENMAAILAKVLDGEITSHDLTGPCQIDSKVVSLLHTTQLQRDPFFGIPGSVLERAPNAMFVRYKSLRRTGESDKEVHERLHLLLVYRNSLPDKR